jgi:hypothetical protein
MMSEPFATQEEVGIHDLAPVSEVMDDVTAAPHAKVEALHIPGQISLAELREQALDQTRGQAAMSDEEMSQAKNEFMSKIDVWKTGTVRGESLLASRAAEEAFDQQQNGGSGLDVIFQKLGNMETKITDEQTTEAKRMSEYNSKCAKEHKKQSDIIALSSKTRQELKSFTVKSNTLITQNRQAWRLSRNNEDAAHKTLVDLQTQREENIQATKAQVNELNKAIDVMQAALFLVCERFARFKNGKICMSVKSKPDVAEPRRYETNPPEEAKEQDKEAHDKKFAQGAAFDAKWSAKKKNDIKLENSPHPEAKASEPKESLGEPRRVVEVAPPGSIAQALAEDEDDIGEWKLSHQERNAQGDLKQMTDLEMPEKYKLPLIELSTAIKLGAEKRSKSIVTILMSILEETRNELYKMKSDATKKLDLDYATSWNLKKTLNAQRLAQVDQRSVMEENRKNILKYNLQGETMRKDIKLAIAAKHFSQDACNLENEKYGVEEAWRIEDLENLVKLRSLLRMLYYRKKPQECPFNPDTKALCSGMDRGWCVFTDKHPKNTQKCSCNVGFYGDACQYTMCPGIAKNLYKHDAAGVCSNTPAETRGKCDKNTGTCTCYDGAGHLRGKHPVNPLSNLGAQINGGYYHGPKRACDFKNAPTSKNGIIDNKCSERGQVYINKADPANPIEYKDGYDKRRGICHCKYEYWGPGCQHKKCPNSNGNLYPSISANSCNGHGTCSNDDGRCTCQMPYHCGKTCSSLKPQGENQCVATCGSGESCSFEDCPEDCRDSKKSACNMQNGVCACKKGTSGPACEFFDCPGADPGSNLCGSGGECNRNDGKCICRKGYSGAKCDKTERCTGKLDTPYVNWWTIWDKPGWITCPPGQLMYRMKRSLCSALSCLNSGGCAAPCEGTGNDQHVFQIRHCYHDLRWYDTFDKPGWSKCLDDYFVSGFYRSGESLYELQMAKCCSLENARWVNCDEANWNSIFNGPGTGKIEKQPKIGFITGLKRGAQHTLSGIDGASYCGFVRGY